MTIRFTVALTTTRTSAPSRLTAILLGCLLLVTGIAMPALAATLVPTGPSFRDDTQSVSIPAQSGVRYHIHQWVNGARVPVIWPGSGLAYAKPGTYTQAQGLHPDQLIEVSATAAGTSDTLSGQTTWAGLLSNTATTPRYDDATSTVNVPVVANVEYRVNGVAVGTSGVDVSTVVDLPATVTITAHSTSAATADAVTRTWSHKFPRLVTPKGPTFNDSAATVSIPADWGIRYFVDADGTNITRDGLAYAKPGTYGAADGLRPGQTITVTAGSAGSDALLSGLQTWVRRFSSVLDTPSFDDLATTVTIPSVNELEYRIDDAPVSAGVHQARPGTTKVTAHLGSGELAGSWPHTFPTVVTPKGPTFNDSAASVTIPADLGVRYHLDADGTSITRDGLTYAKPGTYGAADGLLPGQAITVTARSAGSTTLLTGVQEWTHRFPRGAPSPEFDDAAITVTIPAAEGVEYLVDDRVTPAGTHPGTPGGAVTVTARETASGAQLGSWSHTFPTAVTPKGPEFNHYAGTVQIPSDWGVRYTIVVDGRPVTKDDLPYSRPGTYSSGEGVPAGVPITVTAEAAGAAAVLRGTTTWTQTLAARPGHDLAAGDEFNDPSPLPAQRWKMLNRRVSSLAAHENTVYRPENISVADGNLRIRTLRHCLAPGEDATDANVNAGVCPPGTRTIYSSGRLETDFIYDAPFSMQVRARMADGRIDGMHFAAWIRNDQPYCNASVTSSDLAELDTMEVFTQHALNTNTSHITCTSAGTRRDVHKLDAPIAGVWNTYGMTYDGHAVRYTFNGVPMRTPDGQTDTTAAYLGLNEERFRGAMHDHPWQMIIDSVVFPQNLTWINPPRNDLPFPVRVDLVDYVRMQTAADIQPSGAIGAVWAANRWLGTPVTGELDAGPPQGRKQQFTGGTVYWTPATGALATTGGIRTHWNRLGAEQGWLGYPTSGERALRGGASQSFEHGQIHWSPATGPHSTRGAIQAYWASQGWENGWLGYPTSEEFTGLPGGGASQTFTGGTVFWQPTGRVSNCRGAGCTRP